jgi:hypothetical protein
VRGFSEREHEHRASVRPNDLRPRIAPLPGRSAGSGMKWPKLNVERSDAPPVRQAAAAMGHSGRSKP